MEKKLGLLFDFQKYEKNADLQAVVDAVHARYSARQLTDDEAEWVSAAGTPKMIDGENSFFRISFFR